MSPLKTVYISPFLKLNAFLSSIGDLQEYKNGHPSSVVAVE